jgi:DNA-binding protein HU-beta
LSNAVFGRKNSAFINRIAVFSTKTTVFKGFRLVRSESLLHLFEPNGLSVQCLTHKIKFIMNKAELIEAVAEGAGLTKADAKKAIEATLGSISGALKKNDRVSLVGFGSFSISERGARKGRNPQTGKEIKIAAKKVVKFKAGAELQGKVSKK